MMKFCVRDSGRYPPKVRTANSPALRNLGPLKPIGEKAGEGVDAHF
ncbi:MAG: hypothetical protein AB3N10_08120 [Allomuricauda sp.]